VRETAQKTAFGCFLGDSGGVGGNPAPWRENAGEAGRRCASACPENSLSCFLGDSGEMLGEEAMMRDKVTRERIMRKMKLSIIKRFAGVLCLLSIAVIFSACGEGSINIPYVFDNQSNYTVYITLSKEYLNKGSDGKFTSSGSKTFSVSGNSKREVDVYSSSVDFSWTTYNESDNGSVYCVVRQNKATFRNSRNK